MGDTGLYRALHIAGSVALAALIVLAWSPADAGRRKKKPPPEPEPPPIVEPEYCSHLDAEKAAEYTGFSAASKARYDEGDLPGAINSIMGAKRICDEEPRLDYNLGRTFQKNNNCNMARFWYEKLLSRLENEDPRLLAEERARAALSVSELAAVCTTSALIALQSPSPDAVLTLRNLETGEESVFTYPFEGRVDAGEYEVVATLDGAHTTRQRVVVRANENHEVIVPRFTTDEDLGTLVVRCPAGVEAVELSGGDAESKTLACGSIVSLETGAYDVAFGLGPGDFRETISVGQNRAVDLNLVRPKLPEQELRLSDSGWILVGVGGALAIAGGTMFGVSPLFENDLLAPDGSGGLERDNGVDTDDRAFLLQVIGGATGGVGVALALTGAILILVDDGPDDAVAVAPTPLEDGGAITLRATF